MEVHGRNGPPWFSEGICESLATHTWDGHRLKLGVIPASSNNVPYWGRLKIIRDNLRDKKAPSLDEIIAYSDMAHRSDEPYGWSWAAVLFFSTHPSYKPAFDRCLEAPIGLGDVATKKLKQSLGEDWNNVRIAWDGFLTDLEYGYDPNASWIDVDTAKVGSLTTPKLQKVKSDRGWQSTQILIQKGDAVRVRSKGKYVVKQPVVLEAAEAAPKTKSPSWDEPVAILAEPQELP